MAPYHSDRGNIRYVFVKKETIAEKLIKLNDCPGCPWKGLVCPRSSVTLNRWFGASTCSTSYNHGSGTPEGLIT